MREVGLVKCVERGDFSLLREDLQSPHAELPIAARGIAHRRLRNLPSPHAAFSIPLVLFLVPLYMPGN